MNFLLLCFLCYNKISILSIHSINFCSLCRFLARVKKVVSFPSILILPEKLWLPNKNKNKKKKRKWWWLWKLLDIFRSFRIFIHLLLFVCAPCITSKQDIKIFYFAFEIINILLSTEKYTRIYTNYLSFFL